MADDIDPLDRPSAFGLFNYAASFHAAGDLIAEQGLAATHPDAPTTSLYVHAIELYLKSFLHLRGTSIVSLKSIGHKFGQLRARAVRQGLAITDTDDAVLDELAESDLSGRSRYLETGYFEGVPTAAALRDTCRSLAALVGQAMTEAGHTVRTPSHRNPF
jgi:hypothetical protein